MIDYLKISAALLAPLFFGHVFVTFIVGRKIILNWLEKAALSFLLGCGLLSLTMLLLGLTPFKLNLLSILAASALVASGPFIINLKNGAYSLPAWPQVKPGRFSPFTAALLILICAKLLFALFETMIKPVVGVDAFANWSLRAKVFFVNGGLVLDRLDPFFLGGGATFYPLHLPLLETYLLNALGYWNDQLFKIIFWLFLISFLAIFYFSLRRSTNRLIALLGVYLLCTLPLLLYHATIEYADFPLAVYFSAAALLLLNYFSSAERPYLFLSALLGGIGCWTKSEGLPLLLISLAVIFLYHYLTQKKLFSAVQDLAIYFGLAMVFKLPWSIINVIYHVPKNIYQRIEWEQALANLPRLPIIGEYFYSRMLFYGNWNIAWFVFIVVLILSYHSWRQPRSFYALVFIFLFLAAIAFMYYLTANYTWLLDGTTLNRNTLLIMPLVIYYIVINLPTLLNPNSDRKKR